MGDIVWTFPCDNKDQIAIITKRYHVPSVKTKLLSPQRIFDKQNGPAGKYWGDKESFYLEYNDKPRITIPYAVESNLPIGCTLTTTNDNVHQMNLIILDKNN